MKEQCEEQQKSEFVRVREPYHTEKINILKPCGLEN